jgi:hypothetical protein
MNFLNVFGSQDSSKSMPSGLNKLNGAADFADFKFQTQAVCGVLGRGTNRILSGETACPAVILPVLGLDGAVTNQDETTAREAEITKWENKNNKLYYYLVMNCGPNVRPLIADIPSGNSVQVWKKLSDTYQGSSITDTTQNISKLVRSKMSGELPLYIASINQLGDALTANIAALAERNLAARAAGRHEHIIQELMKIALLLSGLPSYFDPCVQVYG